MNSQKIIFIAFADLLFVAILLPIIPSLLNPTPPPKIYYKSSLINYGYETNQLLDRPTFSGLVKSYSFTKQGILDIKLTLPGNTFFPSSSSQSFLIDTATTQVAVLTAPAQTEIFWSNHSPSSLSELLTPPIPITLVFKDKNNYPPNLDRVKKDPSSFTIFIIIHQYTKS